MGRNEFERPAETAAPTETHSEPPKDARQDAHASDATGGIHQSTADHGGDHGHDDHGHADEIVGPVNVQAWAAGIGGLGIGLAIVLVMARAAGAL